MTANERKAFLCELLFVPVERVNLQRRDLKEAYSIKGNSTAPKMIYHIGEELWDACSRFVGCCKSFVALVLGTPRSDDIFQFFPT